MCSTTHYLDILWHAEWRHLIQRRLSWFLPVSFKKGSGAAWPALLSPPHTGTSLFLWPWRAAGVFRAHLSRSLWGQPLKSPIPPVPAVGAGLSGRTFNCSQRKTGVNRKERKKKQKKKLVLHATCMHLNSSEPRELPVEDLVFQSVYNILQLLFLSFYSFFSLLWAKAVCCVRVYYELIVEVLLSSLLVLSLLITVQIWM